MKNYNPIANGTYVCERRRILKDLGSWKQMTGEEKHFFRPCHRCEAYEKYLTDDTNLCPCNTCKHRKTEIQVDNRMVQLRKKYLEGERK